MLFKRSNVHEQSGHPQTQPIFLLIVAADFILLSAGECNHFIFNMINS